MRILISGASGLIGSALQTRLHAQGHSTSALVRRAPSSGEVQWDPARPLDPHRLAGSDAVVHLAGKNIAGRWTEKFKREVRESRVQSTRTLAEAAAESFRQHRNPRVLICASAIGYYGNRGDELLTEDSPPGQGFLPEVCIAWEEAADPARAAGLRVVHVRIGVVLAAAGGAIPPLLFPFRIGLGGRIGDGRQYWSWVSLDDVVGALTFALAHENLSGPVNAVAPNPARNADFVRALGRELRRPTLLPLPAFAIRAAMGEMGQAFLLDSARVRPAKLEKAGYLFTHPELPDAIHSSLQQRS